MVTEIGDSKWLQMRSDVYIRDKGICWVCHEFVDLQDYDLGHLVDRCRNGENEYDNVTVMHKKCNRSKPRHKTLEDATKWRLMLNIPIHHHNINHKITKATQPVNKTADEKPKLIFSISDLAKTPLLNWVDKQMNNP